MMISSSRYIMAMPPQLERKRNVNKVPYGRENQTGSDSSVRYGKKKEERDVITSHCFEKKFHNLAINSGGKKMR